MYTDLGLEVGLLLGSDYGQGLLPEPSNISVRFSLSLSLLNISLTKSLLTLYLTLHPASLDDLFLLKQQSGYDHHHALSDLSQFSIEFSTSDTNSQGQVSRADKIFLQA